MKLEDQVCSLDLAKKLKELGVKQESLFYWASLKCWENWHLNTTPHLMIKVNSVEVSRHPASQLVTTFLNFDQGNMQILGFHKKEAISFCYSAFTVAELGEMLPKEFASGRVGNDDRYLSFKDEILPITIPSKRDNTEANARAKMLIWLIENGKVKV